MSSPTDPGARARMPLIDRIAAGALDEEYVEVAHRRSSSNGDGGGGPGPARPGLLAAAAVAVFAVLVTISFQQTRDNADVVDAGRATLEDRIRTRRQVVSQAQEQIAALRAANAEAESALDVLDEADAQAELRVTRLRDDTGLAAATGEGITVQVDDNPDGLARHRVYDEDLALLVNGLWEAGARAVAVNGYRLTVLSAFRFSGQSINLNELDVSLEPPYVVAALGDKQTLAADLLDTTTGLQFEARVQEFGFARVLQNQDRLVLPAAPARLATSLRSASLATIPGPDGKENAP